jgi:predicted amidophosphoribosyltransferase
MECKTCGKEIAKTAVSCPHCGAKYKNTLGDWILLLSQLPTT